MKETTGCIVVLGIAGLLLSSTALVIRGCAYANKAVNVALNEVDPAVMLKRYQWFKDVSAQCDKKLADIQVYENRFKILKDQYENKPRSEWAREDREQFNLWSQESAGIQASYNALAAEYNAAMAKINYRFTNVGDLPAGATQPLPREFKPYIE